MIHYPWAAHHAHRAMLRYVNKDSLWKLQSLEMMAENFLEKHSEDLTTISEGQSRPMTINDSKNDIIRLWLCSNIYLYHSDCKDLVWKDSLDQCCKTQHWRKNGRGHQLRKLTNFWEKLQNLASITQTWKTWNLTTWKTQKKQEINKFCNTAPHSWWKLFS